MINSVLKLSTTTRKNKIIPGFTHPILLFLVLHEFRMRDIVKPYLQKEKKEDIWIYYIGKEINKKLLNVVLSII